MRPPAGGELGVGLAATDVVNGWAPPLGEGVAGGVLPPGPLSTSTDGPAPMATVGDLRRDRVAQRTPSWNRSPCTGLGSAFQVTPASVERQTCGRQSLPPAATMRSPVTDSERHRQVADADAVEGHGQRVTAGFQARPSADRHTTGWPWPAASST